MLDRRSDCNRFISIHGLTSDSIFTSTRLGWNIQGEISLTVAKQLMDRLSVFPAFIIAVALIGCAQLVDPRDGSAVWFNLIRKQSGDLRTEGEE